MENTEIKQFNSIQFKLQEKGGKSKDVEKHGSHIKK